MPDSRGSVRQSTDLISRLAPVGVALVLMWLVTAVNLVLLQGTWLRYGIQPRDPAGPCKHPAHRNIIPRSDNVPAAPLEEQSSRQQETSLFDQAGHDEGAERLPA